MKRWVRNLWSKQSPPGRPPRSARPGLECLEGREVPAVTYHGGALLQNVEVQAVYYGSDWNNAANSARRGQLESFLHDIVQGDYMDMLGNAYGTGRGSCGSALTYAAVLNKSAYLPDGAIRTVLQTSI